MNNEPCVRLGMRISPKISEKPADNRNNRLPNVMLLTVSRSQKVISAVFPLLVFRAPHSRSSPRKRGPGAKFAVSANTTLDSRLRGNKRKMGRSRRRQHFVTGG